MTLNEARFAIGRGVIYYDHNRLNEGVIISVNDSFVFVRYGSDTVSRATLAETLRFSVER